MTILITGPESSGKTTLARALAEQLNGIYVPEAARNYLAETAGQYEATDLPKIWTQQAATEDAARASGADYVICDTGPTVLRIWAEVKYGHCPTPLLNAAKERTYDLIFLCYPDLPWEPDPLREAPKVQQRQLLFDRYHQLLGATAIVIRGDQRLETALAAVRALKQEDK